MNSEELKEALKRKQAEWRKAIKKIERWETYQAIGSGKVPDEGEVEEARNLLESAIMPSKGAKSSYEAGKRESDRKWQEAVEELEPNKEIAYEIERKAKGDLK